jgi:hypothetical protein
MQSHYFLFPTITSIIVGLIYLTKVAAQTQSKQTPPYARRRRKLRVLVFQSDPWYNGRMSDELVPIERLKQVVSALLAVPKSAISSPFSPPKKPDEKTGEANSQNDVTRSKKKRPS